MDIGRSLKSVIATGSVAIGERSCRRALEKGDVKLVICANNCPSEFMDELSKEKKTPIHQYDGNNSMLGAACGKPFTVSTVAILDAGASDILSLKK
tara:strand:+ start:5491 stop:5778 length:288 start_codon:yes stop_codon:yes gene_type:complete